MKSLLCIFCCTLICFTLNAQESPNTEQAKDSMLITVFLKHQQDKNLSEIGTILEKNKFWEQFPPKSATVVSWYVMMGIGQVVTLKIPGGTLRELNLSIEKGAWGAFDTEFYPTYDLYPIVKEKYDSVK